MDQEITVHVTMDEAEGVLLALVHSHVQMNSVSGDEFTDLAGRVGLLIDHWQKETGLVFQPGVGVIKPN